LPVLPLHLLPGVLLGVMAADKAPSRCTEHSVPASHVMPGDASNACALEAALRICGWRSKAQRERDSSDRQELVHSVLLRCPSYEQRRRSENP
jgi:hypothetical protein